MAKAYLRKGTASLKLEEFQTAKAALEAGVSLAHGDSRFTNLIKECDQCIAEKEMVMNCSRSLRRILIYKDPFGVVARTFSAKAKKGLKGGVASQAPKESTLSKKVKSTMVVGANILKDGTDPKIMADSEYPDWLWHLLDKKTALSELTRKNTETLLYEHLKHFFKLDTRAWIKENNGLKANPKKNKKSADDQ